MDEPFGALDPITRRELQDEFRGLQRGWGRRSSSSLTTSARPAGSPTGWPCRHGRLVQPGPPADFLERRPTIRPLVLPRCRGVHADPARSPDVTRLARAPDDPRQWQPSWRRRPRTSTWSARRSCSRSSSACRWASWPAGRRGPSGCVGLANVLQTIPSLALLGFLLILFRGQIGKPACPARRWWSMRSCRSSRTRSWG